MQGRRRLVLKMDEKIDFLLRLSNPLEIWKTPFDEIAVALRGCEIKKDGFLISDFGRGKSIREAVDDYLKKISGKTLVFNATSGSRREVTTVMFHAD